jgi:hypothetical protein
LRAGDKAVLWFRLDWVNQRRTFTGTFPLPSFFLKDLKHLKKVKEPIVEVAKERAKTGALPRTIHFCPNGLFV